MVTNDGLLCTVHAATQLHAECKGVLYIIYYVTGNAQNNNTHLSTLIWFS